MVCTNKGLRRNKVLIPATKQMILGNILLYQISQRQKYRYYISHYLDEVPRRDRFRETAEWWLAGTVWKEGTRVIIYHV